MARSHRIVLERVILLLFKKLFQKTFQKNCGLYGVICHQEILTLAFPGARSTEGERRGWGLTGSDVQQ